MSVLPQCSSSLGTFQSWFMSIQCKSCCLFRHLPCRYRSANIAYSVDFPFMNTNCSSHVLQMFLSRFISLILLYSVTDVLIHILEDYQDAFSPLCVWDLLHGELVRFFLQKSHYNSSQTLPITCQDSINYYLLTLFVFASPIP